VVPIKRRRHPAPEPARFSFHSPLGACPPCQGFGRVQALDLEVTLSDQARGVIEARATSKLFRFVDDVAIRVRPKEGGSVVDIRSKSRVGQGDMGANADRIRAIAARLAPPS